MRSSKIKGALFGALLAVGFASVSPLAAADPDSDVGAGHGKKRSNNLYIVRMADSPAVAYTGGIPGYQATKPRKGQKIDPDNPNVVRYAGYLEARHNDAVARVNGRKAYSYKYSFNGFAAELTAVQAEAIKSAPGVLSVEKDELYDMDTSFTPTFLGLNDPAPTGLWSKAKGENIIIGIVDSGVWPEHPSYSDRTGVNGNATQDGKLGYQQIPGWHGKCTPGELFNASNCNQKLIGARYYNAGWGGSAQVKALFPFEFISPRDWGGHGSHTSSTAGGNEGVQATGISAGLGKISGIAPRARIAAYKVCWADQPTGGGCFGSDSVAAIDQAVADGVDVINFSISGTSTNFRDAVEIAFMFAADAGVFVAASAGNAGTASSVAHPGPWLTTVAAGTHSRNGVGSITLGNGAVVTGASYAAALPSKPVIYGKDAAISPADVAKAEVCLAAADNVVGGVPTPVLDPAKVAGKIVLCKRGSNVLVNKTGAVAAAGGVGAVIYNDVGTANTTFAILHVVPTVHVAAGNVGPLKAYMLSTASPTGSIAQATIVANVPAPTWATFSSMGPLKAGGGDLLKPDLMAPGQDILAAVAPPNNGGQLFSSYQGTSMSSPHVAGLAALLKELHPDWSPMAIKSALMTTATDILNGPGTNPSITFAQGAGHVVPNIAANPGLVFDAGLADWMAFICGTQPGSFCLPGQARDASDLNVASIAIGDLAGSQTVTRRVTNVSGSAQEFAVAVTPMTGFNVVVDQPVLNIPRGATAQFTVTFTRTDAALNTYGGGQLTLSNASHNVRVPVVVRPVPLSAPVSASASYSVKFGFDGPFTATGRGLIPAVVTADSVAQDPDQEFVQADSTGTVAIPVSIPAGTTYLRFAMFDADVSPGSDVDVYVYQGTTLVGASTNSGSTEEINFTFASPTPPGINLTVYVHGWLAVGGSSPFKLHTWALGTASAGNMTVTAPTTAVTGATGTIGLAFSGLAPATKYLGSVAYTGPAGMPSPTIIRVDTP